jgi:hypothetical protein
MKRSLIAQITAIAPPTKPITLAILFIRTTLRNRKGVHGAT